MLTAKELNAILPYTFNGEIEYLQDLAKKLPEEAHTVILGAGPGIMSIAILESRPNMALMAVDHNKAVADTYFAHLEAAGFYSSVWIGDTLEPLEVTELWYKENPPDLLIIDADHSEQAVIRDFEGWYPYVKTDGYVFFHDYIDLEKNGTNGVKKAVDFIAEKYKETFKFVDQPGISYVIQKVV